MMIDLDSLDVLDVMNDPSSTLTQAALKPDDQLISATANPLRISKFCSRLSMSDEHVNHTDLITCMLVTANVGTIFEEVSHIC